MSAALSRPSREDRPARARSSTAPAGPPRPRRRYTTRRATSWRLAPGRYGSSRRRQRHRVGEGARMNTLDLFRLDGRTAVVTGGGRGLGRYMAEALSDAGANVVLCSRKVEPLEEVRSEIEAGGGRALAVECDVTDPEDVERVVSQAEEAFGSLDIVVNNSGATWGAPPAEMP